MIILLHNDRDMIYLVLPGVHEPLKVAKERVTYAYMRVPSKYKFVNFQIWKLVFQSSVTMTTHKRTCSALAR